MKTFVRSSCAMFSRLALALPLIALAPTAALHAQDLGRDRNPSAASVALSPLADFNLARDPIPPALWEARANPYASEGIESCADILTRLGDLDAVLGEDFDASPIVEGNLSAAGVAQSLVNLLLPFRGVIREVSGANEREEAFRLAIAAGMTRRAYLKGLGEARGCDYPARPMTAAMARRLGVGRTAPPNARANGGQEPTQFVSEPVVQQVD